MTLLAAILAVVALAGLGPGARAHDAFAFSFDAIGGGTLPLERFRGKALLVVNTASFCGFTRQYEDLQAVWTAYRDRGLVVIGVPSNDFGGQEPGSEEEIKRFCEVTFGVDFPLSAKTGVAGSGAHPFFRWAAAELGAAHKPRWNFHKYLVAPDGSLVTSFSTMISPRAKAVSHAIERHLPPAPDRPATPSD